MRPRRAIAALAVPGPPGTLLETSPGCADDAFIHRSWFRPVGEGRLCGSCDGGDEEARAALLREAGQPGEDR